MCQGLKQCCFVNHPFGFLLVPSRLIIGNEIISPRGFSLAKWLQLIEWLVPMWFRTVTAVVLSHMSSMCVLFLLLGKVGNPINIPKTKHPQWRHRCSLPQTQLERHPWLWCAWVPVGVGCDMMFLCEISTILAHPCLPGRGACEHQNHLLIVLMPYICHSPISGNTRVHSLPQGSWKQSSNLQAVSRIVGLVMHNNNLQHVFMSVAFYGVNLMVISTEFMTNPKVMIS